MSTATTKLIQEILAESEPVDNSEVLARLWGVMGELMAKVNGRFQLAPNPKTEQFLNYAAPGGQVQGEMHTFTGPEIAYLANTWLGNPTGGFLNLHLNIWLPPQYRVPHLGIVFGTIPDLFFFTDYPPRADMWQDIAHLDRYYQSTNQQIIEVYATEGVTPFISQSAFIRQAASPAALCFTTKLSEGSLALVSQLAHQRLDQWLAWLEEPEFTPEAEIEAIARRDYQIRLACGQRDPANPIGEKLLGKETAVQLLEGLWGINWNDKLY